MDTLIDFLLNNYIWFLIIALILIFALIGYLVDASTINDRKIKNEVKPISEVEEEVQEVHPSVMAYTNEDFDDPLMK